MIRAEVCVLGETGGEFICRSIDRGDSVIGFLGLLYVGAVLNFWIGDAWGWVGIGWRRDGERTIRC
jgi:hypothetical protein